MAKANPTGPSDSVSPAEADRQTQSAVLSMLLIEHPTQLTALELVLELANDPEDFGQRDAVERAVRDLAGFGLVHRQSGTVRPTRAALRFQALEMD